jgi:hypothetical protein
MILWILILGSWVGVLLLILHDATKDDGEQGSVISTATKNSKIALKTLVLTGSALAVQVLLYARKLRSAYRNTTWRHTLRKQAATQNLPVSIDPIPQGSLVREGAQLAPEPKKSRWGRDHRTPISARELESVIAEAVKTSNPSCKDFIGVVVEQTKPKSRAAANWSLRGIKFGKADRGIANAALATCVQRMQQDFWLAEK